MKELDNVSIVDRIMNLFRNNNIKYKDNEITINCVKDSFQILVMNGKYKGNGFMTGVSGNDDIIEYRMLQDEELINLIEEIRKEYDIYDYLLLNDRIHFVFSKLNEELEFCVLELTIESIRNININMVKHYNEIIFDVYGNELIKTPTIKTKYDKCLSKKKNEIIDTLDRDTILNMLNLLDENELKSLVENIPNSIFKDLYEKENVNEDSYVRKLIPKIIEEKE